MNDNDLAFASIPEIGKLFRKRKLSPVELTKLMLARIDHLNPKLNAYITVTGEVALSQAKKAEAELFAPRGRKGHRDRGPLHGIPISLKDNIYTEGIRTTAGSKILKDFIPQHDAPVVAQLKEAGAVLLGKTNMHEFAYGATNINSYFGSTHNPWDLARITGGSSGGSAAAVVAGLCYGSIGTDTGGSIRIPAALCGVVGLKPSLGSVSTKNVIPLSTSLDVVGPLARTVSDAALLFDVIRTSSIPQHALRSPRPSFARIRKTRLGIPKDFFFDLLTPQVASAFDSAVKLLRKHGAQIKKVSLPLIKESEDAGNQIAWAEALLYHQQSGWFPNRASEYGEDVRTRLEMGTKVDAVTYLKALQIRGHLFAEFQMLLDEHKLDALLVPTTPIAAPLLDEESISINGASYPARALLLRLNRPANLAGIPAISVPCGLSPNDLPVGLQFLGPLHSEPLLLALAAHFQRLTLPHVEVPFALPPASK